LVQQEEGNKRGLWARGTIYGPGVQARGRSSKAERTNKKGLADYREEKSSKGGAAVPATLTDYASQQNRPGVASLTTDLVMHCQRNTSDALYL